MHRIRVFFRQISSDFDAGSDFGAPDLFHAACRRPWTALISCLISLCLPAISTNAATFSPVPEAELAKALAKYQKIATLSVHFRQKKSLKDMDLNLESEGDLELTPPQRVIYKVNKPARLVVTMTPSEIRFENGSGSDATVQTFKTTAIPGETEKRNMQAMVNWLKMDPQALSREYLISTDHENNFHFAPREVATSPFQQLELKLGSSGHVKHLTMHERSGDQIEFFFDEPKITYSSKKAPLSASDRRQRTEQKAKPEVKATPEPVPTEAPKPSGKM